MDDKRLYICAKIIEDKSFILGVFSNRKILFDTLKIVGLDDCYILGSRKKKNVTPESIATGFVGRGLNIFKDIDDKSSIVYKVLEINMNEINPYYKKKYMI